MLDRFGIATEQEILEGKTSDIYFLRTEDILRKESMNRNVVMEVAQKGMPEYYPFGIFTGLSDALKLLEGRPVDVYAIPEGSVFSENLPVMTIEGDYLAFGEMETAVLGFLCHASGVTTSAAQFTLAAGGKPVLSFGARRVHPAISAIVDTYAYIGGCSGFSSLMAEQLIGKPASGTVPHALILQVGSTVEAMLLFDKHIRPDIPRVALVDTFSDEKFEALAVAKALGDKLSGIRLDTPSSRRGSMRKIAEEVRWELDLRGFSHVKIYASGGLSLHAVRELRDVVDGFGVGTAVSNARVLDFSMDIVEMNGEPFAKKGKASGRKEAWGCTRCIGQRTLPAGAHDVTCPVCSSPMRMLTRKVMENGVIICPPETPETLHARVTGQFPRLVNAGMCKER